MVDTCPRNGVLFVPHIKVVCWTAQTTMATWTSRRLLRGSDRVDELFAHLVHGPRCRCVAVSSQSQSHVEQQANAKTLLAQNELRIRRISCVCVHRHREALMLSKKAKDSLLSTSGSNTASTLLHSKHTRLPRRPATSHLSQRDASPCNFHTLLMILMKVCLKNFPTQRLRRCVLRHIS